MFNNKNPEIDSVFGEYSSPTQMRMEMDEHKLSNKLQKSMTIIKKNKAFLGLVDSWKAKVLDIAVALTDYIPDNTQRFEAKQKLSEKIKSFRTNKLPLGKTPQYSL